MVFLLAGCRQEGNDALLLPSNDSRINNQHGIIYFGHHPFTGTLYSIYEGGADTARQSYFAEEDLGFTRDSTEFLHTEHVLLVDRKGHIRGIYNGTLQLEAEQLIKDIEKLLEQ